MNAFSILCKPEQRTTNRISLEPDGFKGHTRKGAHGIAVAFPDQLLTGYGGRKFGKSFPAVLEYEPLAVRENAVADQILQICYGLLMGFSGMFNMLGR